MYSVKFFFVVLCGPAPGQVVCRDGKLHDTRIPVWPVHLCPCTKVAFFLMGTSKKSLISQGPLKVLLVHPKNPFTKLRPGGPRL